MGATAIIGGKILSGGLKVAATLAQAEEEGNALDFARETALQDITLERRRASLEDQRVRRRNRRFLATQRANAGASGFRADVGSPLEFAARQAAELEADAVNVQIANKLRERGLVNRIDQLSARKTNVKRGARLTAVGQLLGTGASAFGTAADANLV